MNQARLNRSLSADDGGGLALPVPPPIEASATLPASQWGMLAFLLSEVAFFGTLIVVYLSFLGRDVAGPTPAEALSLPLALATTTCLLASSLTIHRAESKLHRGDGSAFLVWWGATIALGVVFLLGTAFEWRGLIAEHHLTIGRNLFGSTYYTLVGFHGLHVTAGIVAMMIMLGLASRLPPRDRPREGIRLISWYWHFVDGVWIVVFGVVYLLGR